MTQHYTSFQTAIGPLAIAWTAKGICRLQLSEKTEAKTVAVLKQKLAEAQETDAPLFVQRAIEQIKLHLEGINQDFRDIPLDLRQCSEFSRKVYAAAREVLAGQVVSYGEIANRIGSAKAARAVGGALGANPVAIIVPCHRIIGKSGKMTGFSAYGGCDTKLKLLAIEQSCCASIVLPVIVPHG